MSYGPKKTLPLGFISKMEALKWNPANRIMKNLNFFSYVFAKYYSIISLYSKVFLTMTHKIIQIFAT